VQDAKQFYLHNLARSRVYVEAEYGDVQLPLIGGCLSFSDGLRLGREQATVGSLVANGQLILHTPRYQRTLRGTPGRFDLVSLRMRTSMRPCCRLRAVRN
jgi:hypothetical protein